MTASLPDVAERAPGDLPIAEFLAHGHRLIEWIGAYLAEPERFPVVARVAPGEVSAQLPPAPPARGEALADVLADFERVIVPGVTHWNHPGFFAYFAISASAPGILGELLAAALNVNAMLWKTGPSATELEARALDWLRQLMGLGPGWDGVINDTASISTLLALASAREAKAELQIRARGMAGRADLPALRVYCSEHAHSSVEKAAITLGLGLDHVVKIGVDAEYRMRVDLLEAAIEADRAAGMLPLCCVATIGTTSVTSVDPVGEIAEVCRAEDVWLHVDGAYGGIAAVVPELQELMDGVHLADSLVVNPHKWLFTPIDCSAFYTRHDDVLRRAFSLVPEYLVTREQGAVRNLMDTGPQLGRRFRALKLWMVIRAFGAEGLAERIRYHVQLAQAFGAWVAAAPDWVVAAPHPMSLVVFRWAPPSLADDAADAANLRILERVNASGEAYLSHTRLDGRVVLRLAIGNLRTERRHVARAWALLQEAAEAEAAP